MMAEFADYLDFENSQDYDVPLDYYQYYYPEFKETILDIWENCVVLSIASILPTVTTLILLNFCFGSLLSTGIISPSLFHIGTASIGVYLLNTLENPSGKLVLLVCFLSSYILLHLSDFLHKTTSISRGNFIKIISVILLILCEYFLVHPDIWLQIRGILMILVMKLISLADDLDNSHKTPSILQYFGYVLCGANVMFGPWMSYQNYLSLYFKPPKRSIYWLVGIIQTLVTSFVFLSLSNCWAGYAIPDDSNRWFIAYREAFSFRTSHYFICYLSECSMIAAGFRNTKTQIHRYITTEPLEIELPPSLAIVVKKWNQPMHEFLKKYVYRSWLPHGRFIAFLATFLMSSFLHGFELKVSVVLINIGIFSYLQVIPRNKFSDVFNCCIKVRPCRDCNHKYKRDNIRVKILLFIFSLTSILHLLYLGILMDPSTDEIGIFNKWKNLYFISHIIMFFNGLLII